MRKCNGCMLFMNSCYFTLKNPSKHPDRLDISLNLLHLFRALRNLKRKLYVIKIRNTFCVFLFLRIHFILVKLVKSNSKLALITTDMPQ